MAHVRSDSPNTALTCPACFAREIDPIFLRYDQQDAEYYCLKCTYFASDQATVYAFYTAIRKLRYRISSSNTADNS